MKTVYIHPGFWKCASTSIQKFLQNNHETLLKHGIYYPCDVQSQRFSNCIVPFFSEVGNHIIENRKFQAKKLLV
jgi:Zn-finger protein